MPDERGLPDIDDEPAGVLYPAPADLDQLATDEAVGRFLADRLAECRAAGTHKHEGMEMQSEGRVIVCPRCRSWWRAAP